MSMGAERSEAPTYFGGGSSSGGERASFLGPAEIAEDAQPEAAEPSQRILLAAFLLLLAAAWCGTAGWAIASSGVPATVAAIVSWIATFSVPLVLLGIVWLIFGRTRRREAERFTRTVAAMRSEAKALETVLAGVSSRIEENRSRLSDEAARLMALGDEASDRLGRVTHYLAREGAELGRRTQALDGATERARVDIGVLLEDLPRAEEQARGVAAAMREAGLTAHEQAGALEGQLAALAARGREADEVVGGAAQRLGAHVARIETGAGAASARIEQAATALNAAVDAALGRATAAVEATRVGLDAQGSAMLANIEQSRSAFEQAGAEASRRIGERLDEIGARLEALGGSLAQRQAASDALVGGLSRELAVLENRLADLAQAGSDNSALLGASIEDVRGAARSLQAELEAGDTQASALSGRTRDLTDALNGLSAQLQIEIPDALGSIEAQAERTYAAAERIGPSVEAAGALAEQVYAAAERLETLSSGLAEQERASRAVFAGIVAEVEAVEGKVAQLGEAGAFNAGRLTDAMAEVRASLQALHQDVRESHETTGLGVERVQELARTLETIGGQLASDLPSALAGFEQHAARAHATAETLLPQVETVQAAAGAAAANLAAGEQSIRRQQEDFGALLTTIVDGVALAEERLQALAVAAGDADGEARRILGETGPALIDALVRVREAANQAASHAREAISAAIPESVAALAEASRDAVSDAVTEPVQEKLTQLGLMSESAVAAARRASERLTRQLVTIGETAASIETRLEEDRRHREKNDADSLSRRVALLIESLNSTAIDVTKILSNEVTDSAWAAYLKGDRGVFTRRAVRLLESGEAREVLRHYEEEPEFRDQVNRYIHDFEAMLRRVLADKDGSPLSITLLSSDMGKLYVALAQAIERLRN